MNTETAYIKVSKKHIEIVCDFLETKGAGHMATLLQNGIQKEAEQPEAKQGKEDLAEAYAKASCHNSNFSYHDIYPAFIAGYNAALEVRQTGYTITEEQIEELYGMGKEGYSESISDKLEEWFPEVFKPTPTYTPGQRFIVADAKYILTKNGWVWRFFNLNTGFPEGGNFESVAIMDSLTDKEILFMTNNVPFRLIE